MEEVGFIVSGDAAALTPALAADWADLGPVPVVRHRAHDLGAVDPAEIGTFAP